MSVATYDMEGLANEVFRQAEAAIDCVQSTQRLTLSVKDGTPILDVFEDDGRPVAQLDGGLKLTEHAHGQLATALGIPKEFYDRLRGAEVNQGLYTDTVNHFFQTDPKRRLIRVLDDKVRAFLSDGYRRIDNWDIVKNVYGLLQSMPDVHYPKLILTETNMYIRAALPRIRAEVRVGDWVEAGVVCRNSEVGAGAWHVYPYTFRLTCLNGQVSEQFGESGRHVGRRIDESDSARLIYSDETRRLDDQALMAKMTDIVRACCDETLFTNIVMQCKELAAIRMDAPPSQVCERLFKKELVSKTESEAILNNIAAEGDLTGWGLLNAITATGREAEDADRAYELEKLGGKLASDPSLALSLVA